MAHPQTIRVLGAGYGGLAAARRLGTRLRDERLADRVRVTLVDRHPYHLLETRLHEAVARGSEVTFPIERALTGLPVEFRQARVERVHLAAREIRLGHGETLPYDALIVALGSRTNFFGIPGLAEHALELKDLDDVEAIRARIERAVTTAAAEPNPQRRRERLTVVIGGGGLTGVELAAELGETLPGLVVAAGIEPRDLDLILVEAGPRILPTLDETLSQRAARELAERHVRVLAGIRIVEAGSDGVRLDPGGWLRAGLVVWTGGIKAATLLGGDGSVETGRQGRLLVTPTLMLSGHEGAFAVGDIALALDPETGEPVPPAAQFALQQGEVAADNALAWLAGRPLAVYRPRLAGELVSLGRHAAVGWAALPWAGRLRLVGQLGALLKWASQARYQVRLAGPAGLRLGEAPEPGHAEDEAAHAR
jgi:NADH dehydrogenase